MHKYYEICACLRDVEGKLSDKTKPFKTYYVEAESEHDAIESLKTTLPGIDVVVYGKPKMKLMTDHEYESVNNEKA